MKNIMELINFINFINEFVCLDKEDKLVKATGLSEEWKNRLETKISNSDILRGKVEFVFKIIPLNQMITKNKITILYQYLNFEELNKLSVPELFELLNLLEQTSKEIEDTGIDLVASYKQFISQTQDNIFEKREENINIENIVTYLHILFIYNNTLEIVQTKISEENLLRVKKGLLFILSIMLLLTFIITRIIQ